MTDFRTIHGADGYTAHQLGRFGEVTGGWRIERNGAAICEAASEIDARVLLLVFAAVPPREWAAKMRVALYDMSKERAA